MLRVGAFVASLVAVALGGGAAARPATYSVEHCIEPGPTLPAFFCLEGSHEYGTSGQISGQNGSWGITSPAASAPAGYDRAIACDFTGFNLYWRSTLTLSGVIPPVTAGSAVMLVGGVPVGTVQSDGSSIQGVFLASDVITPIPEPTLVIAWNEDGGCYPDCDTDGALTIADFGCFQNAFVGANMYADCNGDTVLTISDFGCFQSAFVTGCP